jgi:predicted small integral membrane protein
MEQRLIKIGLALTVGLLAGLWAINNILNWETAQGAVAYALGQKNQSGYPEHIVPPIKNSATASIGLLLIIFTEMTAGLLALVGSWRMWAQRKADAALFTAAKRFAILGAGVAVFNWFFGFLVVGGALIMMGQAEGMEGAMRGATSMGTMCFLSLIYLSMAEPSRTAD